MAVAEVKAPDANILVRRRRHDELAVVADVHTEHRKFVTVESQEEFQRINEEDFDRVVECGDGKEAGVR